MKQIILLPTCKPHLAYWHLPNLNLLPALSSEGKVWTINVVSFQVPSFYGVHFLCFLVKLNLFLKWQQTKVWRRPKKPWRTCIHTDTHDMWVSKIWSVSYRVVSKCQLSTKLASQILAGDHSVKGNKWCSGYTVMYNHFHIELYHSKWKGLWYALFLTTLSMGGTRKSITYLNKILFWALFKVLFWCPSSAIL